METATWRHRSLSSEASACKRVFDVEGQLQVLRGVHKQGPKLRASSEYFILGAYERTAISRYDELNCTLLHVAKVINYDFPQSAATYIHRQPEYHAHKMSCRGIAWKFQ